jgi:molybdopterin-guanine dinucleotide biosynthesis protein A
VISCPVLPADLRVAGVVLCGGASRRMGTDKALLEIDGRALARRVHDALVAAGCAPVWAVGGDAVALRALGLHVVDDLYPGEGPLGALITALTAVRRQADVVMVLGCDLPDADPQAIEAVCAPFAAPHGDHLDVVVPRSANRHHMHHAAWRVGAVGTLQAAFDSGERAPRRVLPQLRIHQLAVEPLLDPRWLADLDAPDDLVARRRAAPTQPHM